MLSSLRLSLMTSLVAVSLCTPASADDGLNTILKLGAGLLILNEQNKQKPKAQTQQSKRSAAFPKVREAQGLLNQLGFSAGVADGLMGKNTRRAITDFQIAYGLTGHAGINDVLLSNLRQAAAGNLQTSEGAPTASGTVQVDGYPSLVQPLQPAFSANSDGQLTAKQDQSVATTTYTSAIQPIQPAFTQKQSGDLAQTEIERSDSDEASDDTFVSFVKPLQPFVAQVEEPSDTVVSNQPLRDRRIEMADILGVRLDHSFQDAVRAFEARETQWTEPEFSLKENGAWIRTTEDNSETIVVLADENGHVAAVGRTLFAEGFAPSDLVSALKEKYGEPDRMILAPNWDFAALWGSGTRQCETKIAPFSETFPRYFSDSWKTEFVAPLNELNGCQDYITASVKSLEGGAELGVWLISERANALVKKIKVKRKLDL